MPGTVITNKGLQLITKLLTASSGIVFTKATVGTGSLTAGVDPATLTALIAYKKDAVISSYGVDTSAPGNTAYTTVQISSIGNTTSYNISEVGLYATDPDVGEILYAYLDLSGDPQTVPIEGGSTAKVIEITLNVVIDKITNVTATIGSSSLLSRKSDICETTISTFTPSTESFPSITQGGTTKSILGKISKFISDFKTLKPDLITTNNLNNTGTCTTTGSALDARYGKNVQDQLNILQNKVNATATLTAAGWSASAPFKQTINVAGITADDTPIISLFTPDSMSAADKAVKKTNCAFIDEGDTMAGQIMFTCFNKKPTVDFQILIRGI